MSVGGVCWAYNKLKQTHLIPAAICTFQLQQITAVRVVKLSTSHQIVGVVLECLLDRPVWAHNNIIIYSVDRGNIYTKGISLLRQRQVSILIGLGGRVIGQGSLVAGQSTGQYSETTTERPE